MKEVNIRSSGNIFTPYTLFEYQFDYVKAIIRGRNTSDTIDINLINIFSEGPEVSLQGSPTVSPITVAL